MSTNDTLSRKQFLVVALGSLAASVLDCSADDSVAPAGGGGSGTGTGSGGTSNGESGSMAGTNSGTGGSNGTGTGGSGTGGSGTGGGGGSGTGGSGTGGSGTGGGGTGGGGGGGTGGAGGKGGSGGSGGSGGTGTDGGGGGGSMCMAKITAKVGKADGAANGHIHMLEVPLADVMAGTTKTFQTAKDATNHMHCVELTAADFTMLKAGMVVKKMSCNGGNHEYVFSCAAVVPEAGTPVCAGETPGACM